MERDSLLLEAFGPCLPDKKVDERMPGVRGGHEGMPLYSPTYVVLELSGQIENWVFSGFFFSIFGIFFFGSSELRVTYLDTSTVDMRLPVYKGGWGWG